MQKFVDAVAACFIPQEEGFVYRFGENNEYELWFEKLLFNNQYYVALYKDKELQIDKVVIKPGK